MPGPTIDSSGITIQSFEEIFAELVAGFQAIYGADIDLSQNTPDGQRVAIFAKGFHDMQAFGLSVANNFDPDFARGLSQAKIAKLAGIFPRPATRSNWDLQVTSTRNVELPTGYQISDDLGQLWELQAPISVSVGVSPITFVASEFGGVTGLAGAIFTPVTVVLGISGFTASVNAIPGKNAETDEEFLQKRNRSLENPGFSTTGSLNAQLLNLPGVTDAYVYENDTDDFGPPENPEWALDAHSIWAIVEGGTIDDIMQTTLFRKTGGTGMKGDIETEISETLTRPDGSTFEIVHRRRFDRPIYERVYIRLTATRKDPLVPVDAALIKQKIAAYKFYINTPLQAGKLYEYAYQAGDTFVLTDLEVSTDGVVFTDGRIAPTPGGKFTISVGDVTVNEVIP